MDFFQNQEVARKKTGWLIVYFLLAVILIILTVYVAIAVVLQMAGPAERDGAPGSLLSLWDPELFGAVAVGTAALISGGSLYKIASLAGGGQTVAEQLGRPAVAPADDRSR